MTVKVYMKSNKKINFHETLFENYALGLYETLNNVHFIEDLYLDYRFYDKEKNVIASMSKDMFYFKVKEI